MGTEENYLDNLLKSITEPKPDAEQDVAAEELVSKQIPEIKEEEVVRDEQMDEEIMQLMPAPDVVEETAIDEEETIIPDLMSNDNDIPTETEIIDIPKELETADVTEISDVLEVPDELDIADISNELNISNIPDTLEVPDELDVPDVAEELEIADIPEVSDTLEAADVSMDSDIIEMIDTSDEPEIADVLEGSDIPEISEESEELEIINIPEELEMSELLQVPDELELSEVTDQTVIEESDPEVETEEQVHSETDANTELDIGNIDELDMPEIEIPDIEEADSVLGIENIDNISDLDMPEPAGDETETQLADELNIDGLEMEESAPSEMELGMSDELNLEDLDLDTVELEAPNTDDDLGILDSIDMDEELKDNGASDVDDGLDDVLSMLDDDADLAEINDILKKSDSNEPIQDEMMDLLNQMADDEAALVNAGVKSVEEDGGVLIPDMPSEMADVDNNSEEQVLPKKKKKSEDGEKKPGALGKLFNLLTEELPGPTEADYAAEDAKKAAKKQETLTKKEEEKLAKEEAKQAKAEEKEAAKKAKAEVAAQKKKEKDEAKAKKMAEKQAKQAAEAGKRAKRIPPKKIAAVAVFGASVFGGVIVATNVLSNQGYINVAKKAFYDGNYKEVYLATYGMNLRDSDALIQGKSEVILKMQRWYDSYQNNLKLGREREALDALIRSIESYDYINAEAEEYGVLNEVNGIKETILGVLQSEYGVSEEQARALLNYGDALEYTVALNNIITGK